MPRSGRSRRPPRDTNADRGLPRLRRQSSQLPLAFTHYQRALQLDPATGAHGIGEVYLVANKT